MSYANEPAFPGEYQRMGDAQSGFSLLKCNFPGLTKREYFAAKVIQGILACPDRSGAPGAYAKDAVELADALLAALEATPAATSGAARG